MIRILILILILGALGCGNQQKTTMKSYSSVPSIGIYNLDTSKSNLHTFNDFKFELVKKDKYYEMKFISCEKYGYSDSWKPGMTFAIVDSLIDSTNQLYLGRVNEHRGAEKMELTSHKIQLKSNEIIIFTGDYLDHYSLVK